MLSISMSSIPGKKRASYADLAALPPNTVGELLAGELYAHPRPASQHARASSRLGALIGGPFDTGRGGPGGWVILDEPELHLGPDVLVPDLAGWRRARMPEMPHAPFFTLAPDWVCEVLSPSTAGVDRVVKLGIYLREQVGHVWLIEPANQTLEVLRLTSGAWQVAGNYAGESGVRAEPFAEVELELGLLWAR